MELDGSLYISQIAVQELGPQYAEIYIELTYQGQAQRTMIQDGFDAIEWNETFKFPTKVQFSLALALHLDSPLLLRLCNRSGKCLARTEIELPSLNPGKTALVETTLEEGPIIQLEACLLVGNSAISNSPPPSQMMSPSGVRGAPSFRRSRTSPLRNYSFSTEPSEVPLAKTWTRGEHKYSSPKSGEGKRVQPYPNTVTVSAEGIAKPKREQSLPSPTRQAGIKERPNKDKEVRVPSNAPLLVVSAIETDEEPAHVIEVIDPKPATSKQRVTKEPTLSLPIPKRAVSFHFADDEDEGEEGAADDGDDEHEQHVQADKQLTPNSEHKVKFQAGSGQSGGLIKRQPTAFPRAALAGGDDDDDDDGAEEEGNGEAAGGKAEDQGKPQISAVCQPNLSAKGRSTCLQKGIAQKKERIVEGKGRDKVDPQLCMASSSPVKKPTSLPKATGSSTEVQPNGTADIDKVVNARQSSRSPVPCHPMSEMLAPEELIGRSRTNTPSPSPPCHSTINALACLIDTFDSRHAQELLTSIIHDQWGTQCATASAATSPWAQRVLRSLQDATGDQELFGLWMNFLRTLLSEGFQQKEHRPTYQDCVHLMDMQLEGMLAASTSDLRYERHRLQAMQEELQTMQLQNAHDIVTDLRHQLNREKSLTASLAANLAALRELRCGDVEVWKAEFMRYRTRFAPDNSGGDYSPGVCDAMGAKLQAIEDLQRDLSQELINIQRLQQQLRSFHVMSSTALDPSMLKAEYHSLLNPQLHQFSTTPPQAQPRGAQSNRPPLSHMDQLTFRSAEYMGCRNPVTSRLLVDPHSFSTRPPESSPTLLTLAGQHSRPPSPANQWPAHAVRSFPQTTIEKRTTGHHCCLYSCRICNPMASSSRGPPLHLPWPGASDNG